MPLGGLSLKPLFEEEEPERYATFLHHYTQVPMEYLFEPPTKVRTWLWGPGGEPNYMDVSEYPEW